MKPVETLKEVKTERTIEVPIAKAVPPNIQPAIDFAASAAEIVRQAAKGSEKGAKASKGKPIILSTGLSNFSEINKTLNLIRKYHNKIVLMQCTSLYPCPYEKIGLNVINELKKNFNLKTGFSDHSGDPLISFLAITQGADMIEAHVTYDKDIKTFDGTSSLNFKEFKFLTKSIKIFEKINTNKVNKKIIPGFLKKNKQLFEKSIFLNKSLFKNHILSFKDLSFKKPVIGIHASDYQKCIGKKLIRDIEINNPLKWKDLK
jgi:N-acetylneuraminate synthase